jgi:hypothetical protein
VKETINPETGFITSAAAVTYIVLRNNPAESAA